jgi:hypothetical protein
MAATWVFSSSSTGSIALLRNFTGFPGEIVCRISIVAVFIIGIVVTVRYPARVMRRLAFATSGSPGISGVTPPVRLR